MILITNIIINIIYKIKNISYQSTLDFGRIILFQMIQINQVLYFLIGKILLNIKITTFKTLALNYFPRRSPPKYFRRFITFHN